MSKALKKAGFRFVGPTTCYSLMQVRLLTISPAAGNLFTLTRTCHDMHPVAKLTNRPSSKW